MIRPLTSNQITLRDLKKCKMTPIFFDTFFNLEKYLDHEQRDPFATQRETDEDGNEVQIIYPLLLTKKIYIYYSDNQKTVECVVCLLMIKRN